MLAALYQRAEETRARIEALSAPVAERLAPYFFKAQDLFAVALPYAVKAFHYGFIPFVLFLGMHSEPRPKLIDLLMPM